MLDHPDLTKLIFGRLSWEAIPFLEPILLFTFIAVVLGGVALLGAITYFRVWGTLWRDWITSIDHKKIGIFISVMPGARIFTMVAIRLMPDSSVPTPAICKDHM